MPYHSRKPSHFKKTAPKPHSFKMKDSKNLEKGMDFGTKEHTRTEEEYVEYARARNKGLTKAQEKAVKEQYRYQKAHGTEHYMKGQNHNVATVRRDYSVGKRVVVNETTRARNREALRSEGVTKYSSLTDEAKKDVDERIKKEHAVVHTHNCVPAGYGGQYEYDRYNPKSGRHEAAPCTCEEDAREERDERTDVHGGEKSSEAVELELYGHNDAELYRQRHEPIVKNLVRKKENGVYDHDKAVKLFGYEADDAARKYSKEFGNGGSGKDIFDQKARKQYAEERAREFETEYGYGNYDNYHTKKYVKAQKPKKVPKTVIEYNVQGNYGSRFEDVTAESDYREARNRLKEYRENEPQYAHRIVKRRVPNPAYKRE